MSKTTKEIGDNFLNYQEWLWKNIGRYKGRIIISMFVVIIRGIMLLVPALITQQIIDVILPSGSFKKLALCAAILILIPIMVTLLIIVDLFIDQYILQIMSKVRSDIYNGIQYRPLEWFNHILLGDLISRMLDETESVTKFAYFGMGSVVWFNVTIVVGLCLLLSKNVKITLLLFSCILGQTYIMSLLGKQQKQNTKHIKENSALLANSMIESLTGIQFIKVTASEEKEIEKASQLIDQQSALYRKQRILELYHNLVKVGFSGGANLIIYFLGGQLILKQQLTIGQLIAINSLYTWIQPAIFGYQDMYIGRSKIVPSLKRIFEIMYEPEYEDSNKYPLGAVELCVDGVTFAYRLQPGQVVINNANFVIEEGQTVSLVGTSGSGKSTIALLILGLLQPQNGCIKVTNIDIKEINRNWIKRNMLCVSQISQVRDTTILDNILWGEEEISEDRINEILDVVCLSKWIKQLPYGVNTSTGEQGARVSGGERQKICIARAIVRRPRILILDEATSAMDNMTEAQIIHNIKQFLSNSIVILITHKENTISFCDRTFRLNTEGYIQEIVAEK